MLTMDWDQSTTKWAKAQIVPDLDEARYRVAESKRDFGASGDVPQASGWGFT